MTGFIRTLGGDIEATEAGPVFTHEHLIIDSPLVAETMPHIHLHSVEDAISEVGLCVAAGVRMMVDAMPAGSGRDPRKLAEVSIRSGMRIVATTGLHTSKFYDDVDWARNEPADLLAERFIADIEEGIDAHDYRGDVVERVEVRAGVIKVASLTAVLTGRDREMFEAAAVAHRRTGAPILTHVEGGEGGMTQIEELTRLGVKTDRIAISHTDKVKDLGYHRELLSSGVRLSYDQGLRDPEATARLVNQMAGEGFERQIMLGTDGARRSLWSSLGGSPGLAHLYTGLKGLIEASPEILFVDNPGRWLTLTPEESSG